MDFPSKLVEQAIEEISKLPGIGKKTALRLVMHLLKEDTQQTLNLSDALVNLRKHIKYCQNCHSISDHDLCNVCVSDSRDHQLICVVQETKDVLVIENTGQYRGTYHVLGGLIKPIDGVGPDDLNINSLVERVRRDKVNEIILALSASMEGDTTAFYIHKKLKEFPVKLTTIARGIPVGGELEYTDEITLGRSITTRVTYNFS